MKTNKPILSQEELYKKYKNLIYYATKNYQHISGARFDYEDLIQIAYIALITAYDNWDPVKGSFTTIALTCMNRQIRRYILKNFSPFSHSGRSYIDLDGISFVIFDSEEEVGIHDSQPKIDEIVEIAKKEAKSERQFNYWYRRYILDDRVADISEEENLSRSQIHKLIAELNRKIKKIYFE